jgi:putative ABC transport system ATP-binding protein
MAVIEELNLRRGVAVALVTHDADIAARAHRQVCLRDGLIESDSGPAETGDVGVTGERAR